MAVSQRAVGANQAGRGHAMSYSFGAVSDKAGRAINEDNCTHELQAPPPGKEHLGILVAVADGMGGGSVGKSASSIAIESLVDQYFEGIEGVSNPLETLQYAVNSANGAVYAFASNRGKAGSIGTTMVAAALVGSRVFITNVGDSRAYLVRDGQATQITRDQNWANDQIDKGTMDAAAAHAHENAALLTHLLGMAPNIQMPLSGQADNQKFSFQRDLQPGDALVLCSDGVSNVVSPAEIASLATVTPAQRAATQLVARAKSNGTTDNATAVVVHYGAPPKPSPISRFPPWLIAAFGGVLALVMLIVAGLAYDANVGGNGVATDSTAEPLVTATSRVIATPTAEPTATVPEGEPTSTMAPTLTPEPTPTEPPPPTAVPWVPPPQPPQQPQQPQQPPPEPVQPWVPPPEPVQPWVPPPAPPPPAPAPAPPPPAPANPEPVKPPGT